MTLYDWLLITGIISVVLILVLGLVLVLLNRQKIRIESKIDQILKEFADQISYHETRQKQQLSMVVTELKKEINTFLKIEESSKTVMEQIDNLTDLIQTIHQSNTKYFPLLLQNLKLNYQNIHNLQNILENLKPVFSEINNVSNNLLTKEPISRMTETLTTETLFDEEEKKLIDQFNRMLADREQEQVFHKNFSQLLPASCNRDGIILCIPKTSDEDLWIVSLINNPYAVLLPSRRLLTNPIILTSNGEIASRLIGSCFEIIMRDDIGCASLIRFADAEVLERNASGQILQARIKKKGQLELPSAKR